MPWLPSLTHYEDGEENMHHGNVAPLEPWIAHREADYSFDKDDPYMSNDAAKRSQLSKDIVADFSLTPEPLWRRTWSDGQGKQVLTSSAWGARNGLGRRDDFETGDSVSCDSDFLRKLLVQRDRNLLILINLEHTKDYERHREMEDAQRYTRTLVALLVDKNLKVRVVPPTPAQIKAVSKLGQRYLPDFDRRYAVIARLKSPAPKKKVQTGGRKKKRAKKKIPRTR